MNAPTFAQVVEQGSALRQQFTDSGLIAVGGATQPQSALTRFAEASETEPHDLKAAPLSAYRCLRPPFTDWEFTANVSRRLAQDLLKLELTGALPQNLDAGFFGEPTTWPSRRARPWRSPPSPIST